MLPKDRKLDFFIVGAQKAGTTSLYDYMRQHRDIFLPFSKDFFAFNDDPHYGVTESKLPRYYRDYGGQELIGGSNVQVLPFESAIRNLHRYRPDIKIIIMLRNPIDRAYSAFWMMRRTGLEPCETFEAALDLDADRGTSDDFRTRAELRYIEHGFYDEQVTNVLRYFEPEQVHIALFDDLAKDPQATTGRTLSWLGVESCNSGIDFTFRRNESSRPRSPMLESLIKSRGAWKRVYHRAAPLRLRILINERIMSGIEERILQPYQYPKLATSTRERLLEIYLLVLARFLSVEETGVFLYGIGFYLALIVLANFGQPVLLASRLKLRPGSAHHLISHSLSLRLICVGLAFSAGVLITAFSEPDDRIRSVVYVFLATLVVRSLASWVRECFIGLEDTTWIVRYEILFRGGEAITGVCLLGAGAGLYVIVALHFVFWAAEATFSLVRLRRHLGDRKILGRDFRLIRRIVPISFVFMLSLGLFNVFPQIGVIAMKFIHADLAVIANFGIAVQFFTTVAIFPTAMGLAVMPAIGRLSRRNASAEIANVTTVVKLALLLGGLLAIFADPFARNLISAVLGERYHLGGMTFGILSWALGPFSAALIAGQALNALNARGLAARGSMIMVVAHALVFVALLSFGPLQAATWSLMIGALLGCGANCWSLASVLATRSHLWWLSPLCLCALAFLLSHLVPQPAALVAPALALAVVLASWWLKIVSLSDLSSILGRVRLAGRMGAA